MASQAAGRAIRQGLANKTAGLWVTARRHASAVALADHARGADAMSILALIARGAGVLIVARRAIFSHVAQPELAVHIGHGRVNGSGGVLAKTRNIRNDRPVLFRTGTRHIEQNNKNFGQPVHLLSPLFILKPNCRPETRAKPESVSKPIFRSQDAKKPQSIAMSLRLTQIDF